MAKDDSKKRLRRSIDDNLQRVYDDALAQDVPARFADLLAQLRAAEADKAKPAPGEDDE